MGSQGELGSDGGPEAAGGAAGGAKRDEWCAVRRARLVSRFRWARYLARGGWDAMPRRASHSDALGWAGTASATLEAGQGMALAGMDRHSQGCGGPRTLEMPAGGVYF